MKPKTNANPSIALNRRALHDYHIEERIEAGIALEGWEVKSLRAGKVQIDQSYVILKNGEAWLLGGLITPLMTASTHVHPDPQRTRKLLLKRAELHKLIGNVERKGYTLIPLDLHWRNNHIKLTIALAKGKKQHDKRADDKERDWQREKQRIMKSHR